MNLPQIGENLGLKRAMGIKIALIGKILFGIVGVLATAMALGACSTSDPDTVRVETWGTQSTRVGNGPTQTTNTHTVTHRAVEVVPEKALLGNWQLKDEGDRSCLVELYLPARADHGRRWAQGLVGCSNGMSNIDSWLLAEGRIVLFDAAGTQIGLFEAVTERKYAGDFTLTTGSTYRATLQRF